jgi:hypothetical protein
MKRAIKNFQNIIFYPAVYIYQLAVCLFYFLEHILSKNLKK